MMDTQDLLRSFDLDAGTLQAGGLPVRSPIDGARLADLRPHDADDARRMIARAHEAFLAWRQVPAPRRGELVRLLGEELRAHKSALGRLVSLEAGKIVAEGEGEVQEMIDICDFAVGLSRQLHGLTIASERPGHRMMETWHPLGVVGVISAFNFPVAVWSWNAALAFVCGDSVVWKPSEKTPLTALAVQAIVEMFPSLSRVRMNRQWGGIVDVSPDACPIISKTDIKGLYFNCGWGTGGFKATPGSGWVFAHTVARDEPHPLNKAFSIDRFYSGHLIDEHGAAAVAH